MMSGCSTVSLFLVSIKMGRVVLLLVIAAVGICATTVWGAQVSPVVQCQGQDIENLQELVHLNPCGKTRCKLRKGTNTTVTIRFKPKKDIDNLITVVSANLAGIDLPFIGVSGNTACGRIVNAETKEAAACPLKAGVEYLYTNSFPVEDFYPSVSLKVHWSLQDKGEDVICFEVPATIK